MTETTGEIKPKKRPFEKNAYKYADKQAELYRGLKEPSGGYANIVDAYIAGAMFETKELAKENAEFKKQLYAFDEEREKLRKENAELKGLKDVATLIRANNDTVVTLMQLNNKLVSKEQQLTKAKEIILRLYNAGRDVLMCRAEEKAYDNLSNTINDKSIEQFLKEE